MKWSPLLLQHFSFPERERDELNKCGGARFFVSSFYIRESRAWGKCNKSFCPLAFSVFCLRRKGKCCTVVVDIQNGKPKSISSKSQEASVACSVASKKKQRLHWIFFSPVSVSWLSLSSWRIFSSKAALFCRALSHYMPCSHNSIHPTPTLEQQRMKWPSKGDGRWEGGEK